MAAPFLWAACAEPVEARQFNFVEGFAVLLRRKILRLYMKNRAHFLNRAVARLYNIQKIESLRENGEALNAIKFYKLKQILQILFG